MAAPDPDVVPMLAYEDGPAALDWLARAFGFRERTRLTDAVGRLSYGEMEAGEGLIMLASPTPDYQVAAHWRDVRCPAKSSRSISAYSL
jgi:uncharacterized glyoxalase superfamily protein PhnB